MAVICLTSVSCGSDEPTPTYKQINFNGKDYVYYDYDLPKTFERSSWRNGTLTISFTFGELAEVKKGLYDCLIAIECEGGSKPSAGTNLTDYPHIATQIVISMKSTRIFYESGSAIVESVKDNDYITVKFKDFKCKTRLSEPYTFNGTVKLHYTVH